MPIIQSVERALSILELFDEQHGELKITEISDRMGLHKSTVHSLLKTLQLFRYIDQDPETGKYRLGMKFLERSGVVMQRLDIGRVAKDVLAEIARRTGQTAHLVVLDGREGVYVDKVEGPKAAIRYSRIGRRVPLHCSAVGKALIAFLSEEQLKPLLADYSYARHTENTIANEAELRAELERVRRAGTAEDDEENEPGVHCVAVPVRDHGGAVVAAMSISMLVARVTREEIEEYRALMLDMAERLSARLGYGLA
ncbi:IclR family transcriptional regulator [Paenibacillaceae bacterium WGS1546]|uniref:IclR family transcriptional regulator n=1 Tax=Cohnella sp. WGS1546 TaxID=3366810 RepID=UPI00372D5052